MTVFNNGYIMDVRALRKPSWLKATLGGGETFREVKETLERLNLHTVCQEAACPNLGECWSRGTATFMILGDVCTRSCRFCNVASGHPDPPEEEEPDRVAEAVKELSLKYCVVTSVTRDDLTDGGAAQFAATVETIRRNCPETLVEVLIPDFQGDNDSLEMLVNAAPAVIAHNVETVERLTPVVRDKRTSYRRSLTVLKKIKEIDPGAFTKSGLMVGLGEYGQEVLQTFGDIVETGCTKLTVGQYLQPARGCLPVAEYLAPETFDEYRRAGERMGFQVVASGPLVRSSYLADHVFKRAASMSAKRGVCGGRLQVMDNG